jgi:hypothetical protein
MSDPLIVIISGLVGGAIAYALIFKALRPFFRWLDSRFLERNKEGTR